MKLERFVVYLHQTPPKREKTLEELDRQLAVLRKALESTRRRLEPGEAEYDRLCAEIAEGKIPERICL